MAKSYNRKITKVPKNSQQSLYETVANENDEKIPQKNIYLSREKIRNYWSEITIMEYKKIQNDSKNSQQNNSEAVTNKNDKERYISPKERQKIVDNLGSVIIV